MQVMYAIKHSQGYVIVLQGIDFDKINIHEGHAHFFAQGWSWVSRRQELGNFERFIIDDVGKKISLLRLKSEVENL